MEEDKKDVYVIQLNKYVKPVIKETTGKEWVLNGRNNSFFDYIIERFNGSPTNAAIINGFTEMIYGKGLMVKDPAQEEVLKLFPNKEIRRIVSDFKLFGSATLQVMYSRGRGKLRKVVGVYHIPRQAIAPAKMNEEGDIEEYYYSKDWAKVSRNAPDAYPAFGTSADAPIEIMVIEPYKAGKYYYADPDYLSALQYSQLEEEISNYSINHIQNGLSAGYVLNFNNGVPPIEKREDIKRDVKDKTTGSSSAGTVIVSFNDSAETAPTVTAFPTNASHKEWTFWVSEARTQIMVGHRVTSPMLFGIKDNSGLGNNAEELETATKILHATVIAPMQELILEALMEVAAKNGLEVELEFENLISFTDEEGDVVQDDTVELKKDKSVINDSQIAEDLMKLGEEIDEEEWELCHEEEVTEEMTQMQVNLASDITSSWASTSEQDSELFRVRYSYAPRMISLNSRPFCRILAPASKVFRKEDIIKAGSEGVNAGFGAGGATNYSIWLYKGGVNCKHFWQRKIYLKKNNKKLSVNEAKKLINDASPSDRAALKFPINEPEVAKRPTDMPNNGGLK